MGRRRQRTTQWVSSAEREGVRALKQNSTFSPVPLLPATWDSRLAQDPVLVTPYLNMPGLLMSRFSASPCQFRHFTTVAVLNRVSVLSALASGKLREELPDSAVSRSCLNSECWDFRQQGLVGAERAWGQWKLTGFSEIKESRENSDLSGTCTDIPGPQLSRWNSYNGDISKEECFGPQISISWEMFQKQYMPNNLKIKIFK